jgi:carbonic anhydrase
MDLRNLLERNQRWAAEVTRQSPEFFPTLSQQQAPRFLWIGCSDSRVPANQIVDLPPGELFVHRNVANVVTHTDLNLLSVLQYAVDVLGVEFVIVCGHYGCGGIRAAYENRPLGLIDNWLRHIKDVYDRHAKEIERLQGDAARQDRLCELSVADQVRNVAHTTIVQDAWRRGRRLEVHGWVYGLHDGVLRDLGVAIAGPTQLAQIYRVEPEA